MSDLSPFVQRLRETLSLSSVISTFIPIKRHGQEYQACCPFHKEKTPSFTINDQKGFYHCFGCGVHGDLVRFMMEHQSLPFIEAVHQLANMAGLSVPTFHGKPLSQEQQTLDHAKDSFYAIMEDACTFFQDSLSQNKEACHALKERGCDEDSITKFRIGYSHQKLIPFLEKKGYTPKAIENVGLMLPLEDNQRTSKLARFRNRLMIPIMDRQGRILAFGGRLLEGTLPTDGRKVEQRLAKYVNSPQTVLFNKSRVLFGVHTLDRPSKDNPLIVVEGYFDVIMAQKNGFNAVAPLGTALTADHIHMLWKYTFDPIICFDGDSAGKKAMYRAMTHGLSLVKPGYTLRFAVLPEGEDPDSLLRKQQGNQSFKDALASAKSLFDVFCEAYQEALAFGTPETKALRKKEFMQLLETIQDEDVRRFYKQELFESVQASHRKRAENYKMDRARQNPSFSSPFYPKSQLRSLKIAPAPAVPLPIRKDFADACMQKILLVTLLNHPTLIAQMIEHLMHITFSWEHADTILKEIMDYAMQANQKITQREEDPLMLWKQAASLELLRDPLIALAPFCHAQSSPEEAMSGFLDVWQRYGLKKRLEHDLCLYQEQLKRGWDVSTWEALQHTHKELQSFSMTQE